MQPRLCADELICIRDERVLFEGLSFQLYPGDALEIEGRNGSGKTSLLRILAGLSEPEEGAVRWRDRDIRSWQSSFHGELAYVGHLNGVSSDLTAVENLQFAGSLGDGRADIDFEAALHRVGLLGFEDVLVRRLSAGQRRRVALAHLLLASASLWILDEPLTALDVRGQAMVARLVNDHLSQGGIVVSSTHGGLDYEADARVSRLRLG
ncbi:MAG: cytochrome c biogenesis heme-transporting ATPase CcmA [Pseudomonadota bacterium]|nr:cytochrome c biogenesis heme-transporting ATPase CcmA [Pseudomonadota bacterium]